MPGFIAGIAIVAAFIVGGVSGYWLLRKRIAGTPEVTGQQAQLRSFAEESQVYADRLAAVVEEVNTALVRLGGISSDSLEESGLLKRTSTEASREMERAFDAMKEVATAAEGIRDSSSEMRLESERTREYSIEVKHSLESAGQMLERLQSHNLETEKQLAELIARMAHIEEMNQFIREMVEQTSLLSLNASIEAARAGESGRGFAIVAQEMRKLAEQSSAAVGKSSEIVFGIERSVAETVESIRAEKTAIGQTSTEMERMSAAIAHIVSRIHEADERLLAAAEYTERQLGLTADTAERLGDVVELAAATSAGADRTLSRMEKLSRQMQRLRASSESLQQTAEAIREATASIALPPAANTPAYEASASELEPVRLLLRRLAASPDIRSLDVERHKQRLLEALQQAELVEAVWSNDMDGAFLFSEPAAGLVNAKGRDWWKQAMAGELYVSPIYVSAITKKPCLTLSIAIEDASGIPVGVVGMDMRLKG